MQIEKKMEKKKKMTYVAPTVKITRVVLEQGIAVAVSCVTYMGGDWIEEEEPVGGDTWFDGGDIVLSF